MADTGERSPTTNSGFSFAPASAHDENVATSASTFGIGSARAHTLGGIAGDDLPEGATVNGVKVFITAGHFIFFSYEAATFTSVKLSLDGGSNYSSNILSSNQNTTALAVEYTFGGDSEDWGLDWDGFTDISDLKVEFISFTADGGGNHFFRTFEAFVQVYYTEASSAADPTQQPVRILSGNISILGGKAIIK